MKFRTNLIESGVWKLLKLLKLSKLIIYEASIFNSKIPSANTKDGHFHELLKLFMNSKILK